MDFYDINDRSIRVSFKQAVLKGINAKTGGVFMPSEIGKLSPSMIYRNPPLSFREIVFEISKMFCGDEITDADLMQIIAQFYPYRIPITPIAPTTYILELFHGGTCNYKDIGAGFAAYFMEYLNRRENEPLNIIFASSGEGACAAGAAVSHVKGVNAIILYPQNSLTEIQEKVLSSTAKNVYCLAVDGSLEDCERIVNTALGDAELEKRTKFVPYGPLSIAPLIPQIAFFVYASLSVLYRCGYDNKIEHPDIIASVPSGTFSSLLSGIIAKKMGVPITGFISAENKNHFASDFLTSGSFDLKPLEKTNTPALNPANPVNFSRMLELYSFNELKRLIIPYWLDDERTVEAVSACNDKTGYIIDPYGGTAWQAWQDIYHGALNSLHLKDAEDSTLTGVPAKYSGIETWFQSSSKSNLTGIIFQTSHPAKFPDVMKKAVGRPPSLPYKLESLPYRSDKAVSMPSSYDGFKEWFLNTVL